MKYLYVWESNPRPYGSKARTLTIWPLRLEKERILFAFNLIAELIACQHPPGPRRCGEMNQSNKQNSLFFNYICHTCYMKYNNVNNVP